MKKFVILFMFSIICMIGKAQTPMIIDVSNLSGADTTKKITFSTSGPFTIQVESQGLTGTLNGVFTIYQRVKGSRRWNPINVPGNPKTIDAADDSWQFEDKVGNSTSEYLIRYEKNETTGGYLIVNIQELSVRTSNR
jgi:hypothetical protein